MNRSKSQNSLKNTLEICHKVCVFDLDGVLRIGKDIIKGSEYLLKHLKERGIKTMILTNECRYSVDELKDELSCVKLPVTWLSVIMFVAAKPQYGFS